MWKKKNSSKRLTTARIDTLIGRRVELIGDLRFSGGLHVEGVIKGDVMVREGEGAFLTLGAHGVIEGEVVVQNVVLNGRVIGDVHSTEHIELKQRAVVTGNVYYHFVEMSKGAEVNGNLIHCNDEEMPES